jgi:hydroxyethylthiazole kinase
MAAVQSVSASQIAKIILSVRDKQPLIHCLTNNVVKGFTANALLAAGAAPAMVEHQDEAEEFAAIADALLINLGTLDEPQMRSMRRALFSATSANRPWVLDPVAVGPLTTRTEFAREILDFHPTLIRGNASEILALAGEAEGGRGVDSSDESEAALRAAEQLAATGKTTVLVTGKIDYIVSSTQKGAVANGHVLMTRVTGVGCAMGALAAACLAVSPSPFLAAAATAVWLGVAGELAAEASKRPGSFQVALLDALDSIDEEIISTRANFHAAMEPLN